MENEFNFMSNSSADVDLAKDLSLTPERDSADDGPPSPSGFSSPELKDETKRSSISPIKDDFDDDIVLPDTLAPVGVSIDMEKEKEKKKKKEAKNRKEIEEEEREKMQ